MKGFLDRIENNLAVIIADDEKQQFIIKQSLLPKGSVVGTWFHLTVNNGDIISLSIDEAATSKKNEEMMLLRKKILEKKQHSKYKRQ